MIALKATRIRDTCCDFYIKRNQAAVSFTAVMFAVLAQFGFPACPLSAAAPRPPNIVLIISDDHGYTDFGFMGNAEVQTPNLDRLAAMSAQYPNGYVTSSICRPSLASILTGLYPHHHGIHYNHPPPGAPWLYHFDFDEYTALRDVASHLIRSVPTIPGLLSRAGYRSLQTGKFWERSFRDAGFTDGLTHGRPHPIEDHLGLKPYHGNGDAGLKIGRSTMGPIFDFIDENEQKPFFVCYAPYLPHHPHNPPERIRARYAANTNALTHQQLYYANCTWFDETVGQLVGYIEKKGIAEQTLFIFVSDNGFSLNEYGQMDNRSKLSPYETGIRTPILLRWDGVVKPSVHPQICRSIDIAPTVLDAAGFLELAADLPGISLLPSARGERPLPDLPAFGEIYPADATDYGSPSKFIAYRWLRHGPYKLIVPHVHDELPWNEYELGTALYHVLDDPGERQNLADQEEYREVVQKLTRTLDAWWTPGDDAGVAKPSKEMIRSSWKDAMAPK